MIAKELKASILQLAVTGKLVPQDPNDEPVSVLLERIKAEKAKLVKAGKIKKDKNPSEIVTGSDGAVYEKFKDGTAKDISDELPFEVPNGWAWVRLESLGFYHGGHTPSMSEPSFWGGNILWVSAKDMKCDVIIDTQDKITHKGAAALQMVNADSLVLVTRSGILKHTFPVAIVKTPCTINQDLKAFVPYCTEVTQYLALCLRALQAVILKRYRKKGMTVQSIIWESFIRMPIPLPPLSEQKRIVAKVEKLMPLVEEYGKMEEERIQLDTDLPAALEKSILQEAIQGKLVPQDPNDEPASELLKRIAAERKALVKAGKLKRDKSETVIFRGSDRLAYETRNGVTVRIQDEIPFEIPDSWEWVRLGDLVDTESGLSYRKEDLTIKDNSMVRVLRGGNILDGEFVFKDDDVFIARKMLSGCPTIHRFDFVLPAVTSHVHLGKTALFRDDLNDTCAGGFLLMLHLLFKDIHLAEYLLLYFQSRTYKDYCKTIANKSGQAFFNLSRKKLLQTPIPIPPIAEQSRIVERMRIIKEQIISLTM